jgi:hypothetical protein
MAYRTKYDLLFASKGGVTGKVQLQKDGFSGDVQRLKLVNGGLTIDYKFNDWFDPIIGQSCEISILNDASNWYGLEDLMTLNEREFKVIIDVSDANGNHIELFNGWINSDTVEQKYLNNSVFRISGSNYLSKIDDVNPTIIDQIKKEPIINIINNTLALTGKDASLMVNTSLAPFGGEAMTTTTTALTQTAIDTENFWKNNVEKEGGLTILKKILTPLDLYIYNWNGNWYLERFSEIVNESSTNKHYVKYSNSTSHTFTSTGLSVYQAEPSTDIFSLNHIGSSQTISMIPGLRTIEVGLNQSTYLNLTSPIFEGWSSHDVTATPDPSSRAWTYTTGTVEDASIRASIYTNTYNQILRPAAIVLTAGSNPDITTGEWEKMKYLGLATKFYVTVTDSSAGPTSLNIKWKWRSNVLTAAEDSGWKNTTTSKYKLYYTIKNTNGYVAYDSTNSVWYESFSAPLNNINYIELNPTDVDQATGVYDAAVTIPLTDVSSGSTGDLWYILSLNGSSVVKTSGVESLFTQTNYGDVEITCSSPVQDNLLRGQLSTNVLNKKATDIDIFDITSLNYRNGIYTGETYSTRTTTWNEGGGSEGDKYSLAEWLIGTKFKLYGKNRRTINSDVKYVGFIKPMSYWYDSLDPSGRIYILTSYRYTPEFDRYNMSWWEYEPNEEITFN